MRILVVSALEASSQYAHAINTVKMAEAFARLGHQVSIVCKRSSGSKESEDKLARLYGLSKSLKWIQLPRNLWRYPIDDHWRFALMAIPVILKNRPDMVFTRNYIAPVLTSKLGIPTIAESHAHTDNRTAPFLKMIKATRGKSFRLLVTISDYLSECYRELGVPPEKLLVLPDAVDLNLFARPSTLPPNPYNEKKPIVAYIGHLYDYKGIPTIIETASLLPDIVFHLIGGWPEDVERQRARVENKGLKNVVLHGLIQHSRIPPFLWHSDVLLLPPSLDHPSAKWTSPVKLGEYLASGTPIVATSIPALLDWLSEEEVQFVKPDSPESMAEGILKILDNPERGQMLSKNGILKSQNLSYERRAERLLKLSGLGS